MQLDTRKYTKEDIRNISPVFRSKSGAQFTEKKLDPNNNNSGLKDVKKKVRYISSQEFHVHLLFIKKESYVAYVKK